MSFNFLFILLCIAISIEVMKCGKKLHDNKFFIGSITGSYLLDIISVEDCNLPKSAYHPTARITYHAQPYRVNRKSQRLRANFTVNEDFDNMAGGLIVKYWTANGYIKTFELHNISCHHILMASMSKIMSLSVSPTCTVAAGDYSYDNLDYNRLGHMMVSTMAYGRFSLDMKWINPKGVIACMRTIVISKPDKSYN